MFHFDGVRFVRRGPHPGERFPQSAVLRLLGARDGSLWIVWSNGMVSRLHDGRATTYAAADGMPATFDVTESASGDLVAGTANGLARWVDGRWEDVSRAWGYPGKECHALWFDRQGTLWATTDDQVVYLPPGGRQFIDPGFHLDARQRLTDFAETTDGAIWIAELSRSAHTVPRAGDHHPLTEVRVGAWTLLVDRKGSLWVGSAGDGLRRVLDPTRIRGQQIAQFGKEAEQFTEKDGLLSDVVNAILEDREGNIWVASGRGIERFREGAFSPIVTPGGVRARFVFASRDTSVWTGAVNVSGLIRLHSANRETIPTRLFPYNLAQDSSGVLWAPTGTAVIGRSHGKEFAKVPLRGAWDTFSDLVVGPDGTVWLFDVGFGLVRLSQNRVVRVAPLSDPVDSRGTLFSDRDGRIWIRMRTRAAVYDHGRLTLFDVGKIYSFFQDYTGQVWGVGGGGVGKFEGGRWRQMPFPVALNPNVFGVAEDSEGAWWLATMAGVLRLPPGDAERALADTGYSLHYRIFDLLDGLAGVPTYWGFGPVITRSLDGRIWVAGDSGVASMDPRHLPPVGEVPVLIESVHLNGQELDPTAGMEIPPETGNLEIDYTSTTLAMPERVRFRYQLEGTDRAWNDVGTRRQAYYTGLGPGTYHFHVVAGDVDGAWSENGATWSFRILPAWYQTLWFKGAVVLALGGLVAVSTALMQRRRHLLSEQALRKQHEATLSERARIAQELHDTLLQGMAGVSMQLKAAERALPDQPDVAAETLVQVQQLTRDTLREARQRVLVLHEPDLGDEDVASALDTSGRGLIGNAGIGFFLTAKGERRRLPREVEMAAIRIGREAIANAVKHAEARRIDVVVGFEAAALRLIVRDDGRGFTAEQGEKAGREGHLGLTGMRDRAARGGGSCEVQPAPNGGTEVAVTLPVQHGTAAG
ncbi:MAG TPA: two-component regulator propeller domain-containing protein [Gemmatimonadales bacterium]|nr:two-component regulator propeller domain-containing protein [Gemmatimonadales bacterium]